MPEVEIIFSPEQVPIGSFRLLELPSDLCKLIESSAGDLKCVLTLVIQTIPDASRFSLAIKGGPEDDAVLCTSDRTYNIRSVTLSNSVLVVSPCPDVGASEHRVVVQDSLNELLELVPAIPRLHRLNALLKEHQWEEGHEEEDDNFNTVGLRFEPHRYF
jgi:sister chromatid cohesion protein DCC1